MRSGYAYFLSTVVALFSVVSFFSCSSSNDVVTETAPEEKIVETHEDSLRRIYREAIEYSIEEKLNPIYKHKRDSLLQLNKDK